MNVIVNSKLQTGKFQTINKFQMFKQIKYRLEISLFRGWNLFGTWTLEFGAYK